MSSELMSEMMQAPRAEARTIQRTINLKRLFYTRYKLMLTIAAVIALGLGIPAWFIVSPQYVASATIKFEPTRPSIFPSGQTEVITDYTAFVETEAATMRSAVVQARVANDERVKQSPIIQAQSDPVNYLTNHVMAYHTPNTQHVDIQFQSEDRATALNVVEATVREYQRLATAAESARHGHVTQLLIDEKKRLDEESNNINKQIDNLRNNLGGLPLSAGGEGVDTEFRSYHDNHAKAMGDLTTAEYKAAELESQVARLEAIAAKGPGSKIYEFGIEAKVPSDPTVTGLKNQLAVSEAKLATIADKYLPGMAQVKAQEDETNALRSQVAEAEGRARADILQSTLEQYRLNLESAQSAVQDAKQRVAELQQRIDEYEKEALGARNELDTLEELYKERTATAEEVRKIDQTIRERHAESQAPAYITEGVPANAPEQPNNRRRIQVVAMCFMLGIACGLAVGFLMELFDQQLHSAEDIRFVTDLPLIAAVPHTSADALPQGAKPALVTAEFPGSTTANEYRRILTRIVYPPEGSAEINTCLITSASRNDGKTTLAANLAIALAQANRRVLLLDISARRPSIEKLFGMKAAEGLAEVFRDEIDISDAVRATQFENLYILGPGLDSQDMIGKLASRDMVEFLEKAEEAFEHVIIDSPPVLLMSDGKLLAPVVDGTIVVAGVQNSTIGMLRRCIADLRSVGASLVGVVLSGVRPTRGGYMQKNLDQFYQYGDELMDEPARPAQGFPSRNAGPAPSSTIMLIDAPPMRKSAHFESPYTENIEEASYVSPVLVEPDDIQPLDNLGNPADDRYEDLVELELADEEPIVTVLESDSAAEVDMIGDAIDSDVQAPNATQKADGAESTHFVEEPEIALDLDDAMSYAEESQSNPDLDEPTGEPEEVRDVTTDDRKKPSPFASLDENPVPSPTLTNRKKGPWA